MLNRPKGIKTIRTIKTPYKKVTNILYEVIINRLTKSTNLTPIHKIPPSSPSSDSISREVENDSSLV